MSNTNIFRIAGWCTLLAVLLMISFFVVFSVAPTSGIAEILAVIGVLVLTPVFYASGDERLLGAGGSLGHSGTRRQGGALCRKRRELGCRGNGKRGPRAGAVWAHGGDRGHPVCDRGACRR